MAIERENDFSLNNGLGVLSMRGYDIEGNKIRAFFDASDNLIFVIDDTVTPDKPNALLIINSNDGRKWDDILSNDYAVSLEMVRPKKDNKYQKLDIEYAGLDGYDDLIRDYDDGADLAVPLAALAGFRRDASRRAATERLNAAESAAENARETIARAQESISEQQVRIKTLRTKLGQQKKAVGREPTKQSAAKILRTESQIDAIRDKQARAQRRLDNARRRLVAAEEDAEIARAILARHANGEVASVPVVAPNRDVATVRSAPVAVVKDTPIAKIEIEEETLEPKAEEMAEEVKPLFDKDPEILDEEIAFKPIDFGAIPVTPAPTAQPASAPRFDDYSEPAPVAPLSFVPPSVDTTPVQNYEETMRPAPVLDTITSVEMPAEQTLRPVPVMPEPVNQAPQNEYVDAARPAPIMPAVPGENAAPVAPVRPVSPVTGTPAAMPGNGGADNRRPTLLYYVLLIALIVLSVFTLWLYQKKNSDTVPDLAATAPAQKEETVAASVNEPSPFIQTEEQVTVTPAPEPKVEPVVPVVSEPEPVVAPEPEPVAPIIDETVPAIPVVAEPESEPIDDTTPFLSESEPEPEPVKAPIVVNKPAYNAGSQNENMFVADAEYDTDVVVTPSATTTTMAETTVAQNNILCDDGTLPYEDGCCGDEVYTKIDEGAYACCSESSGECFPPMF